MHQVCTTGLFLLASTLFFSSCKKPQAAPPEQSAPVQSAKGSLELVNCDAITGWACDTSLPNVAVKVDVYDGPTLLATVTADKPWQDLKDKFGNGEHGFCYRFPADLKDSKPHSISAKISGIDTKLAMSPRTVTVPLTSSVPAIADSLVRQRGCGGQAWIFLKYLPGFKQLPLDVLEGFRSCL